MVHFPVSGVEVNPLLPLLVAFAVSALSAPAGVSGAFLLLPFQVSVLGFTSPAVSPTNLVYNVVATPGGVYRYVREGRVVWPLAWVVVLGTLPGAFVGAYLRVIVLSDPGAFEVFVGLVLLYFGIRLLYGVLASFADALALVRKELWAQEEQAFCGSPSATDTVKVPRAFVERLTEAVCYAA
jgi:uncharacterized membrane protein YfcA